MISHPKISPHILPSISSSIAPSFSNGHGAGERLTVVVATRNRAARLARLLRSLESEGEDLEEVVVVVNGTTDEGAGYATRELGSLAENWAGRLRFLCVDRPGKARALNLALGHTRGERIGFLDDDVVVQPGWARSYLEAFRSTGAAGFQGPILAPHGLNGDSAEALNRWDAMRTLPRVETSFGGNGHVQHLVGANMALRRSAVLEAGGFDERLGPGAGGLCEDTELSARLRERWGDFGFVPSATVEHELDEARLTDRYFEEYYRRLGRSRYIQKANSLFLSILPNLAKAALFSVATLPVGRQHLHYRHRGKYYSYHEMLIHSLGLARDDSRGSGGDRGRNGDKRGGAHRNGAQLPHGPLQHAHLASGHLASGHLAGGGLDRNGGSLARNGSG